MTIFGGFQDCYQQDFTFQTTISLALVVDPDYEVVRPYTYRFCSKTPEDDVVLTFNFTQVLASNEFFTGPIAVIITSLYGNDPDPMAILNGVPQFDPTAQMILVPVIGGFNQNDYIVTVESPTNNNFKVLGWPGLLPVRNFPNRLGAP